ncbi:unnamed protein product [Paramecium pentaurelia]|uniref:Protein kinase domain-containing protein n=1 Tax=Paramecium pentaurelia TaxID=43138 RepID=A0A8S1W6Y3_9CILI|nr:unnamed protein product [Paramecium pentaurelia]
MQISYKEAIEQQFENRYRNPEQKGVGAFSKVYKCQNIFGESVAIKVVSLFQVKPLIIPYLKNEVELLKKSDNENVIKLYEAQETQFALFLVLEYCEFDVKTMMKIFFKNKLPEDLVIVILKQLVNGLHYLHKNQIIHRDLKLENIGVVIQPEDLCKLTASNEHLYESIFKNASYKLLDLGLAKQFINQTKTVTFAGTEVNMAPEVLERKPYSFEADIYSLGVCLYQMITGEYPYYDVLHQKDQFQLIKQQDANFEIIENKILRNFIQKMLKYQVEERLTFSQLYQSPYIFNSQQIIPSLLESSLIKNQEFYDWNKQLDNNQLRQGSSKLKKYSYAQFDQSQYSKQNNNSLQKNFFEKINKSIIHNQNVSNNQGNIQNYDFEEMQVRNSNQKSQIGKPKSNLIQKFEKWKQLKNFIMLIQNICERLYNLILDIPDILRYFSFEGEFHCYLQYFTKLGQDMVNQLKEEVNSQSNYSDYELQTELNDSLQKIQFHNVLDVKSSYLSKQVYKLRKYLEQIDSLKEIKEQITLGNLNKDFQRNNAVIFKQILVLLQSIYYQEQELDQDEYQKLNQFNCNLYIILIKLTILEAGFQQKLQIQDDLITNYSLNNFSNDPDSLCTYLGQIMDEYKIQYYDNL